MSAASICLLVSIIFPSGVLVVSSTSPFSCEGLVPHTSVLAPLVVTIVYRMLEVNMGLGGWGQAKLGRLSRSRAHG